MRNLYWTDIDWIWGSGEIVFATITLQVSGQQWLLIQFITSLKIRSIMKLNPGMEGKAQFKYLSFSNKGNTFVRQKPLIYFAI